MTKIWRKVLYENFDVPDNYVDESSFLKNMKTNLYVKEYNLHETIIEAGSIYHQFCWIIIFVFIYIFMSLDIIGISKLVILLFCCIIFGYFIIFLIDRNLDDFLLEIRIGSTTVLFSIILCPVLHTLTASISTDTIYALTLFLLIASWACHTYNSVESLNGKIELNPLSLNAGLMASLCLSSRLPSLWHTFVMVNSAMAIFGLQPNFTGKIKKTFYPHLQISMTIILSLICFLCLWYWLSTFVTVCFVLLALGINFICPLIFIRMQRLKK